LPSHGSWLHSRRNKALHAVKDLTLSFQSHPSAYFTCCRRHRSDLDPFREVRSQSVAPRGKSVVVVRPIGDLPVRRPNYGSTLHRHLTLLREFAVEWLCQRGLTCPFHDHAIPTNEDRVRLQEGVRVELQCFPEELSQALFVFELQPNTVVFEFEPF